MGLVPRDGYGLGSASMSRVDHPSTKSDMEVERGMSNEVGRVDWACQACRACRSLCTRGEPRLHVIDPTYPLSSPRTQSRRLRRGQAPLRPLYNHAACRGLRGIRPPCLSRTGIVLRDQHCHAWVRTCVRFHARPASNSAARVPVGADLRQGIAETSRLESVATHATLEPREAQRGGAWRV
jgi:hypothetical protein